MPTSPTTDQDDFHLPWRYGDATRPDPAARRDPRRTRGRVSGHHGRRVRRGGRGPLALHRSFTTRSRTSWRPSPATPPRPVAASGECDGRDGRADPEGAEELHDLHRGVSHPGPVDRVVASSQASTTRPGPRPPRGAGRGGRRLPRPHRSDVFRGATEDPMSHAHALPRGREARAHRTAPGRRRHRPLRWSARHVKDRPPNVREGGHTRTDRARRVRHAPAVDRDRRVPSTGAGQDAVRTTVTG